MKTKKLISLILCICIALSLSTTMAFAKTGDVIGYAKYTDISAYINHYPITSYNINDYTAVIAEDLRNYGFNVEWDGNSRSLSITKNYAATSITPYGTVYKYSAKAGQNSFPYLETDIVTYVNGRAVESFNIDGKTCVYMDSLAPYGEVVWVPEVRAIKMWINDLPSKDYAPLPEYGTNPYSSSSSSSSSSTSSTKYYPNSTVPTYTSITGVGVKVQDTLSNGAPLYRYTYTSSDDVASYWRALYNAGWSDLNGDDKSTSDVFETSFYKGSNIVIVNVYLDYDEVWITYSEGTSSSSSSSSSSSKYYSGTTIPTYTSVTGVRLKGQDTLSNGSPLYRYEYTSAEDVGDYWRALANAGWELIKSDDKSTSDVFETGFSKGSNIMIVNVYLDLDEVWVTFN